MPFVLQANGVAGLCVLFRAFTCCVLYTSTKNDVKVYLIEKKKISESVYFELLQPTDPSISTSTE